MGDDPDYLEILISNIRKLGFNHGLSRVNNVQLQVYGAFEDFFAKKAGAESAAVVSSGYMAGICAWQELYSASDTCWIAPDVHPAILPTHLKPDLQLSFTQWKNQCLESAEAYSPQRILILGNAVNPLKAEIHEYGWVKEIAKKHEVSLLIDDSHAMGLIGQEIFGTFARMMDPDLNLVVSASLGKGLGMPAGLVLGSKSFIQKIKSRPIFTAASPCAPANLQTFLDTQDIYLSHHRKVLNLSQQFFGTVKDLSTVFGRPDFPIFTYQSAEWAESLEDQGFITSSFSYPLSTSPKINRIVLSGFHQEEDLESLSKVLHQLSQI